MKFNNHRELIFFLMENDKEQNQKQSDLMEFYYNSFDEKTKDAIDIIMMSICGHSLEKIIRHPEKIQV